MRWADFEFTDEQDWAWIKQKKPPKIYRSIAVKGKRKAYFRTQLILSLSKKEQQLANNAERIKAALKSHAAKSSVKPQLPGLNARIISTFEQIGMEAPKSKSRIKTIVISSGGEGFGLREQSLKKLPNLPENISSKIGGEGFDAAIRSKAKTRRLGGSPAQQSASRVTRDALNVIPKATPPVRSNSRLGAMLGGIGALTGVASLYLAGSKNNGN